MEVPIDGIEIVLGDNMSVVNVDSIPESNLSKKHLWICYHSVMEASAASVWEVWFVKGTHNIVNFPTNILSVKVKEKEVDKLMWRNYPGEILSGIYSSMYMSRIE